MTNSSTVEGEHTIQGQDEEVDEEPIEDGVQDIEDQKLQEMVKYSCFFRKEPYACNWYSIFVFQIIFQEPVEPDVVETYSSNLHPNEDEIQLLRLKLDEAQCKNRVIQEEMNNLKSKVNTYVLTPTFFLKRLLTYISGTKCWGDFNSKLFAHQKFLQNLFLGCLWQNNLICRRHFLLFSFSEEIIILLENY